MGPYLTKSTLDEARGIDPDQDTPAAQMIVAAAVWLSTNPEQEHEGEHVLREAARLYFYADPPEDVADWLAEGGIT